MISPICVDPDIDPPLHVIHQKSAEARRKPGGARAAHAASIAIAPAAPAPTEFAAGVSRRTRRPPTRTREEQLQRHIPTPGHATPPPESRCCTTLIGGQHLGGGGELRRRAECASAEWRTPQEHFQHRDIKMERCDEQQKYRQRAS